MHVQAHLPVCPVPSANGSARCGGVHRRRDELEALVPPVQRWPRCAPTPRWTALRTRRHTRRTGADVSCAFQRDPSRKHIATFRRFHAISASAQTEMPHIRTFRLSLVSSRRAEWHEHAGICLRLFASKHGRLRALWRCTPPRRGARNPGARSAKLETVHADVAPDGFVNTTARLPHRGACTLRVSAQSEQKTFGCFSVIPCDFGGHTLRNTSESHIPPLRRVLSERRLAWRLPRTSPSVPCQVRTPPSAVEAASVTGRGWKNWARPYEDVDVAHHRRLRRLRERNGTPFATGSIRPAIFSAIRGENMRPLFDDFMSFRWAPTQKCASCARLASPRLQTLYVHSGSRVRPARAVCERVRRV